jgi:hypothetical protein
MTRNNRIGMALVLVGSIAAGVSRLYAGQTATAATVSAEVTKVERRWETAMHKNDSAAVDKILASDWMGVNSDGTLETRAHFLRAIKNGGYAAMVLDEIDVSNLSGAVVAHGKAHFKDFRYAFTDVFVKAKDGWRAQYSHLALLPLSPRK